MEEKIDHIINFLNEVTQSEYRLKTVATRKLIRARLNDGFTLADFEDVIRSKNVEWKGKLQAQYLRPETLFGNKFEGYLQAARRAGPESKFAKSTREIKESGDKLKSIFNGNS